MGSAILKEKSASFRFSHTFSGGGAVCAGEVFTGEIYSFPPGVSLETESEY